MPDKRSPSKMRPHFEDIQAHYDLSERAHHEVARRG